MLKFVVAQAGRKVRCQWCGEPVVVPAQAVLTGPAAPLPPSGPVTDVVMSTDPHPSRWIGPRRHADGSVEGPTADEGRADANKSKKPTFPPYRWCLLGGLFLLVVVLVSYWLGGDNTWMWTAVVTAVLLFLAFAAAGRSGGLWDLRPRYFILYGIGVLAWWCWVGVGVYFGISRITVEPDWEMKGVAEPDFRARIVYNAKIVATYDGSQKYEFPIRAYRRELLQIEIFRPEGWGECELAGGSTWIVVKKFRTLSLFVDNRRHSAIKLACGQIHIPVAADALTRRTIPAPSQREGYPLTIDGRAVGELNGESYLIDAIGTRSYRLRECVYGGDQLLVDRQRPADAFYRGHHLHKLPKAIDYFLRQAPKKITVWRSQEMKWLGETRMELLEDEGAPLQVESQMIVDSKRDPLLLLLEKNVQDDLRLSAEQKAQLKLSEEKTQAAVEKVIDDLAKGGDANKGQQEINRINEEANKLLRKVKGDLSPEQQRRWMQIELQAAELDAFQMHEVQKELRLSDKQKERIRSVQQSLRQKVKRIVQDGDELKVMVKLLAAARKEAMQQALSTLDDDQKKSWQKMTGPLLELDWGPKFP
jgi:hypothetical protein